MLQSSSLSNSPRTSAISWVIGGNTVTSIDNSTISGNIAETVGAGIWALSPVTVQNTIISNNTIQGQTANCTTNESFTSNGYNISSDSTCNFSSTGDMNDTDPLLGPLLNNGGATDTMAVKPGSPAIDAGNPAGCTDGKGHLILGDQRGDKRPGDPKLTTGCDIGAYEYQFPK